MIDYTQMLTEHGKRIQQICKLRGMTQNELADKIGWHRVTVSDFLYGRTGSPTLSSLEKFAAGLGVKVGDFFDSTGILKSDDHLTNNQFLCPKCGAVLEIREAESNQKRDDIKKQKKEKK